MNSEFVRSACTTTIQSPHLTIPDTMGPHGNCQQDDINQVKKQESLSEATDSDSKVPWNRLRVAPVSQVWRTLVCSMESPESPQTDISVIKKNLEFPKEALFDRLTQSFAKQATLLTAATPYNFLFLLVFYPAYTMHISDLRKRIQFKIWLQRPSV